MNDDWSHPALIEIAELVSARTGLAFVTNGRDRLERAVVQLSRDASIHDAAEFARRLAAGSLDWQALIGQITVGETYFFRDPQHFEFVERHVLPRTAELRGRDHRLRVWSAGCATGEEAYSLAILLNESRKLDGALVLGTDLSQEALSRARAARYRKWSLRGLEPRLLEQYFGRQADEAVLAPALASKVTFQELNLASASYPSASTSTFAMDLIVCRNVLIYLDRPTIAGIARRFFEALSPGGFLITGPSDPLLAHAGFEIEAVPAGIVYRRPSSAGTVLREPKWPEVSPSPSPCPGNDEIEASSLPAGESPGATLAARPAALRELAEQARDQRDHGALLQLASAHQSKLWLAIMAVRARSKALPPAIVERECRVALLRHPLSAELHYLHALLVLGAQPSAAALDLRRAIYLDPSLAIVHFTLGTALSNLGDAPGAERAYRNAVLRSESLPAGQALPCAGEISAFGLASAATRELERLRARSVAK